MSRRQPSAKTLNLDLEPVAGQFALAVAEGKGNEIACYGTRGDGKTFAALIATILHAQKHQQAGYPLPVPWLGVTDTHRSHKLKTCRTLTHPAWLGAWKLYDDEHLAGIGKGSANAIKDSVEKLLARIEFLETNRPPEPPSTPEPEPPPASIEAPPAKEGPSIIRTRLPFRARRE